MRVSGALKSRAVKHVMWWNTVALNPAADDMYPLSNVTFAHDTGVHGFHINAGCCTPAPVPWGCDGGSRVTGMAPQGVEVGLNRVEVPLPCIRLSCCDGECPLRLRRIVFSHRRLREVFRAREDQPEDCKKGARKRGVNARKLVHTRQRKAPLRGARRG